MSNESAEAARPPTGERDFDAKGGVALAIVAAVRVVTLFLGLGPLWDHVWVGHVTKDVYTWAMYFVDARSGLVPYVDFSKEYPVGAGIIFWAMSPFLDPLEGRHMIAVHAIVMTAMDLLNTVLFYRLARQAAPSRAFGLTLLFSLNLTLILLSPVRYEAFVITLVLLGYGKWRDGSPRWASFWWSVGCSVKWFPAFFAAVQEYRALVVGRRRWQWLDSLVVFLLVTLAINGPFIALGLYKHGNITNWAFPYLFHANRPLYWDTVLGVGQMWLGTLPFERFASLWSIALMGVVILVRPRMGLLYKSVLVCLAALVLNRVYSTQFHLWFYPFLLLAAAREPAPVLRRILVLLVTLDVLNVFVYPVSFTWAYDEMTGFWPGSAQGGRGGWGTIVFSVAIVVRAVLLGVLAAVLWKRPDEPDEPGQLAAPSI